MDLKAVSTKIAEPTKSALATITNTLDALAPMAAPLAVRWDTEADRRAKLRTPENLKALMDAQRAHNSARATAASAKSQRTAARAASKNPLSTGRRAARTADKAARNHRESAKVALKAARKNYPATLRARAVQAHAVHAVPGVGITALVWDQAGAWPVTGSLALIVVNVAALAVGRRKVAVEVEDGLSAEERQLVERLDPSHWVQHAEERGLGGTVTTPAEVTSGGIRCDVRLDGKWTVKELAAQVDRIRALLGARTALRIRVTSGPRGGWAVLALATRSAADGVSSRWTPERMPADPLTMSLGLDTETGDEVLVPFDERLLVSGASGTGKSWSTRPLMATAHLRGDLLLIDGKGEEANVWEAVCRVAVEGDEIAAAIDEAWDEMNRRKRDMKARKISVWDGRQLTVVIDEGQVVLANLKLDKSDEGKARMQRLIELSSLGRSRGVVLWWATQYPVTDGAAPGVHQLIAPNLLTRFSLRVAGTTQAQVALDDCAHYAPQQIPEDRAHRGHGYLKGYGPRMIRTWTLDDDGVRALPARHWQPVVFKAPAEPAPLRLVKGDDYVIAPPAAAVPAQPKSQPTNREKVAAAIGAGSRTVADVANVTGINKGSVSKAVKSLVEAGEVHKAEDGALSIATQAGEVSA
ncbi:ATP-binding protein [Streptomyces sp. NPDC029041]|uniref:MarR family transcriptional regulator n=1 Tax=Streptomyces sp. NPDC029041 TaxID=3155727 RepID=UPI0033ED4F4C